jgi:cation diffusion facilitator family transporter
MIFVAAAAILFSAVERLLHPAALESVGLGLAITTVASVINGAVGWLLIRTGREHRSVTLTADGKHLLTDVWTSAGIIVAVLLVAVTGWQRLDPIVAAAVGVNILMTGFRLVSGSVSSLMDAALPSQDIARIEAALAQVRTPDIDFTDVRTRAAGRRRFVTLTVLLPGDWTVARGHDLTDRVEDAIGAALPGAHVQAHVEPAASPAPSLSLSTGPAPPSTGPAPSSGDDVAVVSQGGSTAAAGAQPRSPIHPDHLRQPPFC